MQNTIKAEYYIQYYVMQNTIKIQHTMGGNVLNVCSVESELY